ncbi:hypothetical protein [Sodalis sp. (in: enterobacteria)]
MPCTAWADQKWSTIPRSYLVLSLSSLLTCAKRKDGHRYEHI